MYAISGRANGALVALTFAARLAASANESLARTCVVALRGVMAGAHVAAKHLEL